MKKFRQLVNKLIENPRALFIFFVVINMLPILGLLFTEPLNFTGKLVLFLFPLGLYIILFSLSRNIGFVQLLFFPLLFFHAFQIVVFALFGEDVLSADMMLNVLTTSVSEAGEVLDSLIPSVTFVILVYLSATCFAFKAMRRKIYLRRKFRLRAFLVGVALVLGAYAVSFTAENRNTERFTYHEDVYPVNMIYNIDFAINRWKLSQNYHKTSADFKFNAKKVEQASKREIYVLAVGETGRAENWSLYGYERETTPHLERDTNLIYFPDAITQSNTTHKSVPIMLSAASAEDYDVLYEQKSIVEAFNEVDFTTVFLSNQPANRTFTDFFAQEADIHEYYRFFGDPTNNYDEIIVNRMKHYIDSIPGNVFFVLHLYGSHFNYQERYPKEFAKYQPDHFTNISKGNIDKMKNAYDNTILYTDYILNKTINILSETDACTAMFYASDHGEDLLDDDRERFLHASPSPTFYQLKIPFFFWLSPDYRTDFPEKTSNLQNNKKCPVATNVIFHSFLDMAGIDVNVLNYNLSLMNDKFRLNERMYLDDHYNPISYYNAGLKAEDKVMIEKRGMQH